MPLTCFLYESILRFLRTILVRTRKTGQNQKLQQTLDTTNTPNNTRARKRKQDRNETSTKWKKKQKRQTNLGTISTTMSTHTHKNKNEPGTASPSQGQVPRREPRRCRASSGSGPESC